MPPSSVVSVDGTPLLSWRVLLAEYAYYDEDFQAKMDFSKPWNDPANASFLEGRGQYLYHCPTTEEKRSPYTDYVAVVGPGTVWADEHFTTDAYRDLSGYVIPGAVVPLMVVEWPWSDIDWAEPRDVTVDEFLACFRNPDRPAAYHGDFLLYLDADGGIHDLPLTASDDEVRKVLFGVIPKTSQR